MAGERPHFYGAMYEEGFFSFFSFFNLRFSFYFLRPKCILIYRDRKSILFFPFILYIFSLDTLTQQIHCDIDVRDKLTPTQFLVDYLSIQRPVLIRNALTGMLAQ